MLEIVNIGDKFTPTFRVIEEFHPGAVLELIEIVDDLDKGTINQFCKFRITAPKKPETEWYARLSYVQAFLQKSEAYYYCPNCGQQQLDPNGGVCIECGHPVIERSGTPRVPYQSETHPR